jgi:hypothetical protein
MSIQVSEVLVVSEVAPMSPEAQAATVKFYPRVFAIAAQIIRKSRVHGRLRELAQQDYEGAGTDGLIRAAISQELKLSPAYADVSIRNAIIQYQRDAIRAKTPPSKTDYAPYNHPKLTFEAYTKNWLAERAREYEAQGDTAEDAKIQAQILFDSFTEDQLEDFKDEYRIHEVSFQPYQFDSGLNRAGLFKDSECDRGVEIVTVNPVRFREANVLNRKRHTQELAAAHAKLDGELTRDSDPNLVLYARERLALSALEKFQEPERSILRMRSSLDGKPKTYQEIADTLQLTYDQVYYAHKQALQFLKQPRVANPKATQVNRQLSADYASLCQEIVANDRRALPSVVHTLLPRCEHGMYWPEGHKIAYSCSWCNPNQHQGAQHPEARTNLPLTAATHEYSNAILCEEYRHNVRQGPNPQSYTPNYKRITGTQLGGGTRHWDIKVAPPEGNLEPISDKPLTCPTHITGGNKKQGFARPCLFKGNRYDHSQYGIGIIKADWTPWGEGVEVLFRDGTLRRIAQTPEAKLPNVPAERTLPETCHRMRIDFSMTCGEKIASKSPRTQTIKIHWQHSDIKDWDVIPDQVICSEMYQGFNPFPDGGPSSIGKYAWIRRSDIQPSVDLVRKRTESAVYDSKVFIGPLARPTWQKLNDSFSASNLAAATRLTLRIIH